MAMILITGANGHLGSQTIDFLIQKGAGRKIAGLVRSEEKGKDLKSRDVEIRIGDYFTPDSIKRAMEGIEILAFISSSDLNNRVEQHRNVVDAAKNAGVQHIFYTSIVQAGRLLSPLANDHNETEKLIKESGIPYTFYRNTFYLDLFPMFLGNALETGEWYMPGNGKKIGLALRSEMAEALANGLAGHEKHKNKIYEITSPEVYTLEQYAEMVSEAAGKKITYNDLTVDDFGEQLKKAGLPEGVVQISIATAITFVNGALDITSNDLEKLLGRKPASVPGVIKELMK